MEKCHALAATAGAAGGIRDRPNQARSNRADGAPATAVSESGSTGAYNAALRQRPSVALTTASTWRWQMMMAAADQSHEAIWRQLLRWLAVSAPERVTVEFDREFYNAGDEVHVTATVLDIDYEPDNDATLWMQVNAPLDVLLDQSMEWDIEEDGVYRGSFQVEEEGVYDLLVDVASAAGGRSGESEKRVPFVVTPSLREFNNAAMDTGLLGRIAELSGGSYFDLADIDQLATAVEFAPQCLLRAGQP